MGSVGAVSGWEVAGECCGGRAVAGHAVAREKEIARGGLGTPCASRCIVRITKLMIAQHGLHGSQSWSTMAMVIVMPAHQA